MNDNGMGVVFLIIIGILVVALLPPVVMLLFKPADILFKIILIFILFTTVRGYLGSGPLTIVVSGVLIYFMVFKWGYIFASLYVLQFLLGLSFLSVIIWGIGTRARSG